MPRISKAWDMLNEPRLSGVTGRNIRLDAKSITPAKCAKFPPANCVQCPALPGYPLNMTADNCGQGSLLWLR